MPTADELRQVGKLLRADEPRGVVYRACRELMDIATSGKAKTIPALLPILLPSRPRRHDLHRTCEGEATLVLAVSQAPKGEAAMPLKIRDVPGPRREFVGYGRKRPKVTWPGGETVAVSLVVNYEEGSEYSLAFGDDRGEVLGEIGTVQSPGARDLYVESVYEYGSRAGVWRLLRLLDEYSIKTTIYACAVALERNPGVGDWIRESGHEACSHGWRFSEQWTLTEEEERERIGWAVKSIEQTCSQRPLGWYSRLAPSVNTRRLLVEEGGFLYDSDAYNDDLPYFVTVEGKDHLVVPYNTLPTNDARFVSPSGYSAGSDFVEMCRRGIDELRREGQHGYGSMISIGLHPRLMGQPTRTSALREVIEYVLGLNDVWFARRVDIARFWGENRERLSV